MTLRTVFNLLFLMSLALGFLPAETTHAEVNKGQETLTPPESEVAPKFKNRHRKAREQKREAAKLRKEAETDKAAKEKATTDSTSSSGSASLICKDGKVVYPKNPTPSETQRCARPVPKLKIVGKGTIAEKETP